MSPSFHTAQSITCVCVPKDRTEFAWCSAAYCTTSINSLFTPSNKWKLKSPCTAAVDQLFVLSACYDHKNACAMFKKTRRKKESTAAKWMYVCRHLFSVITIIFYYICSIKLRLFLSIFFPHSHILPSVKPKHTHVNTDRVLCTKLPSVLTEMLSWKRIKSSTVKRPQQWSPWNLGTERWLLLNLCSQYFTFSREETRRWPINPLFLAYKWT